jgi:hypothetical protein
MARLEISGRRAGATALTSPAPVAEMKAPARNDLIDDA